MWYSASGVRASGKVWFWSHVQVGVTEHVWIMCLDFEVAGCGEENAADKCDKTARNIRDALLIIGLNEYIGYL